MSNSDSDDQLGPYTKLTAGVLAIVGGWWGIQTADEWVYTIAGQDISGTLLGAGLLLVGLVALIDGGRDLV